MNPRDRLGRIRLWGFAAESGKYVGGGLYNHVNLEPDESIQEYSTCFYASGWRQKQGYVVLTDRRVIVCGIPLQLSLRAALIPYDVVDDVSVTRQSEIAWPLSLVADAVVIRTRDGRQHSIWPGIQPDLLRLELERARSYVTSRKAVS